MPKIQGARDSIEETRIGDMNKGRKIGNSRQDTLYNSDRHRNFHATCSIPTHATCGGKVDHAKKRYSDQANRHF